MSQDENNVVRRKPVLTLGVFCAVLLLGAGSAATAQNTVGAPGCGPDKEHFDVKTTKSQHPDYMGNGLARRMGHHT